MTHTPSAAPAPVFITAATNPLFKALTRLVQHPSDYRKQGQIWLEGDHLCRAALARGLRAQCAIFSSSLWQAGVAPELLQADKILVMADDLLAKISPLPSPASMGYLLDCTHLLPDTSAINPNTNTAVLDRIQDAGNVGSILRSASAMGFKQILAIKGTAALWSPKVLRAGMGAHFDLQLFEGLHPSDLQHLQTPLLVTHLARPAHAPPCHPAPTLRLGIWARRPRRATRTGRYGAPAATHNPTRRRRIPQRSRRRCHLPAQQRGGTVNTDKQCLDAAIRGRKKYGGERRSRKSYAKVAEVNTKIV